MTAPTMRILSLGAGVQSTTLALMACDGTLPGLDAAIFADTGWEPPAVYRQVDLLGAELERAGVPLYRGTRGNIRTDTTDPTKRFLSLPWYTLAPEGTVNPNCSACNGTGLRGNKSCRRCREGMGRRQCTAEYKIAIVNRKARELLGAQPPRFRNVPRGRVAEQWIGFSTDEIERVNDKPKNLYTRPRHPLLELAMSRKDCERWLNSRGWGHTVKSACIGCPMHGNAAWRALRDTCDCGHHKSNHFEYREECQAFKPAGAAANGLDYGRRCECSRFRNSQWHEAVDFDRAIRKGGARGEQLRGEAFLHRSRVPLDEAPIDHVTAAEWADRQVDLFDVIADLDELENGAPYGCSPHGCRTPETIALGMP